MADKCQECGYVHPYTPLGMCPIANAAKLKQGITNEGQKQATELAISVQKAFTEKFQSLVSDKEKTALCEKVLQVIKE